MAEASMIERVYYKAGNCSNLDHPKASNMDVRAQLKVLFTALVTGAGLSVQAAHTQARLVVAAATAQPGDTVLAGVHLHMEKGWHTYWRNSGQSGLPSNIDWKLPKGVTARSILWPVPEKLPDKEATTYIYENDVILLVPLTIASEVPPGPLQLEAAVG